MLHPFIGAAEFPRRETAACEGGPETPHDQSSERPVQPDLIARDGLDLGYRLGLTEPPSDPHKNARNAMILSIALARLSGASRIFYSRDRNWYARHRSHLPPYFTYRTVIWAAESLAAGAPFFIHAKALPRDPRTNPGRPRRSTLGFGPAITDREMADLLERMRTEPANGVLLRNAHKRPKSFSPTTLTQASCTLLVRHHAQLAETSIVIDHPNLVPLAPGLYRCGLRLVWTGQRALVRIFNGRLSRGGRFYRGFWQQLSKAERAALRIDGEPVFEHDYAACHLRLLYAAADKRYPFDSAAGADPYLVPGAAREDRPLIKVAVLILINAKCEQQAVHALAAKLAERDSGYDLDRAAALLAGIRRHLPDLAPFWCSNVGPALQFVDSEILRHVLAELVEAGVVALPVHDSIIVPAQHGATLVALMETTFRDIGLPLARRRLRHWHRRAARFCDPDLTSLGYCPSASAPSSSHPSSESLARSSLGRPRPAPTKPRRRPSRSAALSSGVGEIDPQQINQTTSPAVSLALSAGLRRKLKRWQQGALPTIVSLDQAQPWRESAISRARFFVQHPTAIARQCAALLSILARDDTAALQRVDAQISSCASLRAELPAGPTLPVDELLAALRGLLPEKTNHGHGE